MYTSTLFTILCAAAGVMAMPHSIIMRGDETVNPDAVLETTCTGDALVSFFPLPLNPTNPIPIQFNSLP